MNAQNLTEQNKADMLELLPVVRESLLAVCAGNAAGLPLRARALRMLRGESVQGVRNLKPTAEETLTLSGLERKF
ncbi:hypothetical protein [Caballeronia sordidicola]|uniref:hypothetical protein n=1 Tax=Caballeronia sordidicola TaxID=196367 RepID=UPI0004D028FF|nr:hypothetical protein [Caballeronia sordidicola]